MTDRFLRIVGRACLGGVLLGLPATIALLLLDRGQWALFAGGILGISLLLPYVVMSIHLAASVDLSEQDKVKWESFWGGLGFIAAFAYPLRVDRRLPHYRAGRG